MINCKNFRENISAYIDNECSMKERLSFDEHSRDCSECKRELDEMIRIVGLCKELPQQELPVNFKADLHEKLVAVAHRQGNNVISIKKPKGFQFLKTFSAVAAGLLLVLLAGSFYKFGLFSPVKMQNSTNDTALAMEQPIAAKAEAMPDAAASAPDSKIAGGTGAQAETFGAAALAPTAPTVPAAAPAGTAEIDRSAAVQNREAVPNIATAGVEAVNSKSSTITISADDPNIMTEKIKALAVSNNAEIVDNAKLMLFSESKTAPKQTDGDQTVAAADNTSSPVQLQFMLKMEETQYEQFVTAMNSEFGAENLKISAIVTEDVTEALNSAVAESIELDNRIQELQKEDNTKNASEIEKLKVSKDETDNRIDELRLGNDFVNVTILVKGK